MTHPARPNRFSLILNGLLGILVCTGTAQGQQANDPTDEERRAQFNAVDEVVSQEGRAHVIVLVSEQAGKNSTLANRLSSASLRPVQTYENFPLAALEINADGLQALEQDPAILGIEEDIPHAPALSESTTLIGAETAWNLGYTGDGQTVAILDSGTHLGHDFVNTNIVAEACYSKTVAGTSTSLCPGGVDSKTGANASAACDAGTLGSACNHGTGVTGVAAGKDPGSAGFDGVAKDASVIAINVFSNHNGDVLAWSSDYVAGLDYVYSLRNTYDIAAANLSLGGGQYNSPCDADRPSTKTAVDQLKAAGIAVIASSGNDGYTGSIGAPACISSVVAVGATTKQDAISGFSNHDELVDVLAPGSAITTAWASNNGYSSVNGTSFSAPMVTGVWALMREADPNSSVDVLLTALKDTGVGITGRSGIAAIPRVQVDAAIADLDCSYDWKLEIVIRDRSRSNTQVRIGQGSQTSDGLDTSCGEAKRPPNPPSSVFAAAFALPGDSLYSGNDYRSNAADTAEWTLDVSGRHPFTLSWDKDRLPSGFFRVRDNIDGSRVNVDMKADDSYRLRDKKVTELVIQRLETGACQEVNYERGWNLISLPLSPLDNRKTALFGTTKLTIYGFDGSYTVPTTLSAGAGYWAYFKRAKTYSICGYDAGTTVAAAEGWNLLAPHDVSVDVDDLTSTPADIAATDFFAFSDGYAAADSLKPGKAYWVRTSSDGVLNVQSSGSKRGLAAPGSPGTDRPIEYLNERSTDSTWASIRFTDATSIQQTLFFSTTPISGDDRFTYLLPPRAPGGAFDVRYADHLQVNDRARAADTLIVQGVTPPLTLVASGNPSYQLVLGSIQTGARYVLRANEPVAVTDNSSLFTIESEPVSVSTVANPHAPEALELFPAFPNPTRRRSTIRFALPSPDRVTISLYNALGQRVNVLLDQVLPAGRHDLPLDAASLPSGTYLYILETAEARRAGRVTVVR